MRMLFLRFAPERYPAGRAMSTNREM